MVERAWPILKYYYTIYMNKLKILISFGVIFFLLNIIARAYETDQYSATFYQLEDSTSLMDEVVNQAIEIIAKNWEGKRDDHTFALKVARTFSARQLEKWVIDNPSIEKFSSMNDSIYKTTSWFNSPIIRYKGLAPTFSLNNVYLGTDKMSHFFGVGGIYYYMAEIENANKPPAEREEIIIKHGALTEKRFWGKLTTNVYSNADLVVNYQGYLFLKSLSQDDVIKGKKAIIRWVGDRPVVQREFTFRNHVNDYWNEALLSNKYQFFMKKKVINVLRKYCTRPFYKKHPKRFIPQNEEMLKKRYAHLHISNKTDRFRLDKICAEFNSWTTSKQQKFIKKQTSLEFKYYTRGLRNVKIPMVELEEVKDSDEKLEIKKLLKKIGSGLPGCNRHIRRAAFEHKKLLEWNKKVADPLNKLLYRSMGQYTVGPKPDLEDFHRLFILVNNTLYGRELSGTNFTNMGKDQYSVTYDLETSIGENSTQLKIILKFLDNSLFRVCLETPVPLEKYGKKVRQDQTLSIKNCYTIDTERKRLEHEVFYYLDSAQRSVFSMPGFYPLEDQLGYIYRNIPYFCKWY